MLNIRNSNGHETLADRDLKLARFSVQVIHFKLDVHVSKHFVKYMFLILIDFVKSYLQ